MGCDNLPEWVQGPFISPTLGRSTLVCHPCYRPGLCVEWNIEGNGPQGELGSAPLSSTPWLSEWGFGERTRDTCAAGPAHPVAGGTGRSSVKSPFPKTSSSMGDVVPVFSPLVTFAVK